MEPPKPVALAARARCAKLGSASPEMASRASGYRPFVHPLPGRQSRHRPAIPPAPQSSRPIAEAAGLPDSWRRVLMTSTGLSSADTAAVDTPPANISLPSRRSIKAALSAITVSRRASSSVVGH
eukprot:scaffold10524_cov113-Isochrysis_galbana.AAC.2